MNPEIKTALFRVLPFFIVLLVLLIQMKRKKINTEEIDLKKPLLMSRFFLWTIGFLVYILATEFLFYKLGILEVSHWDHPLGSSVLRISGAVILAPIVEEIIFRGLILNVLAKRNVNRHLSIVLQALFFVLLHNFAYENTLSSNIGIVQSFIDACLFSYARYHTKSLYTSMAMHITGNLIATIERFIF